ncbi:MAG: biopolymer transporter ExbD, partial [Hydrogenophaga sp.]|nr:biopolymer transporter ExbD [Hydrogenophaga sp.]
MAFGRLGKPAGHRPMSDINVTPLVDVMLVLLVIFILAAPLMASRLALELPQVEAAATAAPDAPAAFVALSMDAQGR